MARWDKLRRSENVEDRRGRAGAAAAGVGGLGIIGVLLALFLGGGGDGGGGLGDLLGGLQGAQAPPPQTEQAEEFQGIDASEDFIGRVLGSTEDYWGPIFANSGQTYRPPQLVLFTEATESACGGANAQVGPHYCPTDRTIYMDLGFFDQLQRQFGLQGGDFAEAYVVAHEVAHHVQNELRVMEEVRRVQQSEPSRANDMSVRLELQADCLAGAWANSIFQLGNVLEPGDIEEALDAAATVGDDRIQQATQGRVNPESWTHGSSADRQRWFATGYESGDPSRCDTFA